MGCRSFDELWDHLFEAARASLTTDAFIDRLATYCAMARMDYTNQELFDDGTLAREQCMAAARERHGLRVIEFTVLGNHLHLLVEADDDLALSRGMQGLCIRIAKALNRVMDDRHGGVCEAVSHLTSGLKQLIGAAGGPAGRAGAWGAAAPGL